MERRRARREEFPRLAAALIGCRYNDLRQRQRQYQMRLMGAGLAALSLLTAYFIWSNIQISANLKQAKISQSRQLADLSRSQLEENDRLMAVRLALEGLPDEDKDRPVIYEATYALSQAEGAYNYPDDADTELTAFYPSRYQTYAYKVSPDMHYMAMLDSKYLLRFFDLKTGEEIGEAETGYGNFVADVSQYIFASYIQLSVINDNELLAANGSRLSAYSMKTGELLWQQFYEQDIFGICVLGEADEKDPDLALVFQDHVLVIESDTRNIRGWFDSGQEDTPFICHPEYPTVYRSYSYGEDERGRTLYFDRTAGKLYLVSRSAADVQAGPVNGILVIDVEKLTSSFCPLSIDCSSQFSFLADEDGFWMLLSKHTEGYALNSDASDPAWRAGYSFKSEGRMTVLHADPNGKVQWEKEITYNGTTMRGYTRLVRYSAEDFDGYDGAWTLGAVFSDQAVFLDPGDGTTLAACRAKSEIVDLSVGVDNTSFLAYTIDGSMAALMPEKEQSGEYAIFPQYVLRGMVRTPAWDEDRNCFLVMLGDGVRLYRMQEGDREYTAFSGGTASNNLIYDSFAGEKYCICNMGGTELSVLDLSDMSTRVITSAQIGNCRQITLLHVDPEENYMVISGETEERTILAKVSLNDPGYELIPVPGLAGDEKKYNFHTKPVCAGGTICYFGVGTVNAVDGAFYMNAYNISTGEWMVQDLDFDMLELLLDPPLDPDGSHALVTDQWENGYLISTADGTAAPLEDKIPAWSSLIWKEDGSAFALIRKDADKEHILCFDKEGKELLRLGRDFVPPLSICFHEKSLWVLYSDHLVCEYDLRTGRQLRSIQADPSAGALDEHITWDFTEDGELFLNMGSVGAQIDLALGGMTAEVRSFVCRIPVQDRILVCYKAGSEKYSFVSYPRYTVGDFIRKGKELVGDMELSEEQKAAYALE